METVVESVAGSSEFGTLDIICSGHKNQFALEDIVCAGKLIERIHAWYLDNIALSDSARSAHQLYKHNSESLKDMIREVDHGRELIDIGMEHDLDICIELDIIPLLPVYADGEIGLIWAWISVIVSYPW